LLRVFPLLTLLLLSQTSKSSAPSSAAAQALLRSGLVALQQRDLPTAERDLKQAATLMPENPYIWASLAQVYWKEGNKTEAMSSAGRAARYSNGNPRVAHGLAIFYTEAQEFKTAGQLEAVFAASPEADPQAGGRVAQLFLNGGDAADALLWAKKYAAAQPGAESQDLLGRAQTASGDAEGALKTLAAAYKEAPENGAIAFDYAHALLEKSDFSLAGDVLEPAARANPQDAQLRLALGVARYGQRRFEEAITAFLKTIDLNPDIPQPYAFLGRVLDQAGDHLAAITADYQAWYQKYPHRFEPAYLLAKAKIAGGGDPAEAEKLLRQSIAEKSDYWASHFELGQLLEKQHKYRQAAAELERAVALNPKEAMPHYHLARVYERLGEADRATRERDIHAQLTAAKPTGDGMTAQ
jgi:Flp pilus assembly protein TadD